MRTLRVRRNSRQGASALADCEVESTTVLSGTARSGRQKPRAQRIPSLPYQIICMFPYQFIWYKKSGRCGHRPLLPNKSFVTPPNSFGVYTNHLYVSVPIHLVRSMHNLFVRLPNKSFGTPQFIWGIYKSFVCFCPVCNIKIFFVRRARYLLCCGTC